MRQSSYFAPDRDGPPQRSVLTALRTRKRRSRDEGGRAGGQVEDTAVTPLSEMEKQVVRLRRRHPDTLLLFECGYRMRIFAEDAARAAAVLGIRAQRHRNFLEASVPVHRTMFHAQRLVLAGLKVGVVRQVDSVAVRAKTPGAQRKPLQRRVTEIYTRATIPELEGRGEDSEGEEDTRARFIACVVEATLHSKPFFSQSMHEADEEIKRSQAFSEEVRIGVFAHDVHAGETKFDEFEDDGKRQRLQRTLEALEPVEFVLPAGRLSAYTEQLLESFVAARRDSAAFTGDGSAEDPRPCVRVERVPNKHFDYSQAQETFRRGLGEAEAEYSCVAACPNLPRLCVCCFGGVWQYLSSLGMEKTLVAPRYSSVASTLAGQFHLPAEAHRDLDLFVNSTTKRGVGSLLSILNHTSTSAGARRLRDWIRTPLRSIPEILERQRTVESLAFPPGALSTEAAPHRIAYEELTTAILPRCRHLLKFLQQVHLGKATPSHAVGALQILRDVEAHVTSLRTTFAAATDSPQPARKQDQVTLVEQLLEGYPTLERHLSGLLEEIDATHARQNDVEKTVQRRLHRRPAQARQYRAFVQELELLDRQYDAVLVCCRGILKSPSLEYSTFRGGSLSDIRHLIPVDRAHLHEVPQGWLVVNSTKKLVRFHPEEVVQLHVQEEFVKEQKQQLLRSTWRQFVRDVDAAVYVPGVKCVEILATLDALCSLATVAQSYPNYARPEFVEAGGATLQIADGRHPVVERLLEGTAYIGNSVSMSSSVAGAGSVLVVSGPNMGGKTSLLRMCALVVILAQMGSFVPAASVRLSVFDGIHTLMHRSTTPFRPQGRGSPPCAQELAALGSISRHATKRSLVLVDEIGFGMPAHYAEAVAIAQMRYLVEAVGSQVVFATHLTTSIEKLQARLGDKCRAKRLEYHFYDQTPTFHYVLRDGIASESFAIETARRAGIPPEILERAHSFQRNLQ